MSAPNPGAALEKLLEECVAGHVGRRGVPARMAVKICGITSVEDARVAVEAGADAVGFVLWPQSPRYLTVPAARAIAATLPPFVHRVGVFVDASAEVMRSAADLIGLDVLQLHGNEDLEALGPLPRRAIKAVRVGPDFDAADALRYEGRTAGVLLDTRIEGALPGGTGRSFDWSLAQALRQRSSYLVLAGGLTPENVAEAVAAVKPDAVDVSSGVESAPGKKDPQKVRAFIRAARGEKR